MSENTYDTRSRASVSSVAGQSYQQVWDPEAQLHTLDLLVAEIRRFNVQVVGTPEDLVNVHSQFHYILHGCRPILQDHSQAYRLLTSAVLFVLNEADLNVDRVLNTVPIDKNKFYDHAEEISGKLAAILTYLLAETTDFRKKLNEEEVGRAKTATGHCLPKIEHHFQRIFHPTEVFEHCTLSSVEKC